MARGQERTVTGGEIPPYAQQSLSQGKEQANNRLVAAMNNAGAAQRQGQAAQAQSVQQGAQLGAEAYQAAAQEAQQDKRAAEAEKARREDENLRRTEMEITQDFHNKSLALQQKQVDALISGREEDRKLRAEQDAYENILDSDSLAQGERLTNGLLSILRVGQNNELRMEKANTETFNAKKRYQDNLSMFDISKENARSYIDRDKTMDLAPGYVGVSPKGISSVPVGEEIRKQGDVANPFQTLQGAVSSGGSKINISSVVGDVGGNELARQISEGKIDASDVGGLLASIDPMLETLDEKIVTAEDEDAKVWKYYRGMIGQIKSTVRNLSRSTIKTQGSTNETVGALVRTGLASADVRYSPTFDAIAYRALKENNGDINAAINKMTEAREPIRLHDVPADASPAMIAAISRRNEIITRAFPDKFPTVEPKSVSFLGQNYNIPE